MVALSIDGDNLLLELSGWEKLGAVRGHDLAFPLASFSSVKRMDNARDGIRGMRAPGTGWPGRIALGSWRTLRTVDFVAVYRNEPGYVIELADQKFDRLVVSAPQTPELDALI